MSILDPTGKPAINPPPGTLAIRVQRAEAGTLEHGRIVQYRVMGEAPMPFFVIAASRYGVEMEGHMPILPTAGIVLFLKLVRRAIRQHEALGSSKIGEPQMLLTEEELDAFDRADTAGGPQVVRFPGGNGLPHAKGV